MRRFTVDHRDRTIITAWHLPAAINRARRLLPAQPPVDPKKMWMLITETRDEDNEKVLRFAAEPLLPGRAEETMVKGIRMDNTTVITGIIDYHAPPGAPAVLYQTVHTKPSWQRRGIATEMLLRLQARLDTYGRPALEAVRTPAGEALAQHLAQHGWDTIK